MDLTKIGTIKKLCEEYGIRPSRKMGQNFLVNPGILEKIVEAGELKKSDTVLEIGPGFGTLTMELVKRAGRVVVVEMDRRLVDFLESRIQEYKNIKIINDDVLKFNPEDLGLESGGYKIISNLPYQITSPVLWKFLYENPAYAKASAGKAELMVLMVQKEVAERIVARPGQMSVLSVLCQFYAECEIVSVVKAGSFWPAPEVDSAIIKLSINQKINKSNKQRNINNFEEDLFFRIVKVGFGNRRKMLKNNLVRGLGLDEGKVVSVLREVGLDERVRAQELSVDEWVQIVKLLSRVLGS